MRALDTAQLLLAMLISATAYAHDMREQDAALQPLLHNITTYCACAYIGAQQC